MRDWSGQRVVILGAARQGIALARYLVSHGATVVMNDRMPESELQEARRALEDLPIEWVYGGHPLDALDGANLICPSGGVPLTLPIIIEARRRGIPLSNDSQIFLEAVNCKTIGITGSAGKTTTTTLVGRIASASIQESNHGYPAKVWVGGNIGSPLIAQVDEMGLADLAVMELSSFQLEVMTRSPQIAAVLNITPNHLDRHSSMQEYTEAKARILLFQSKEDVAVLNRDDPGSWGLLDRVMGELVSFGCYKPLSDKAGTYLSEDGEALLLHPSPDRTGKDSLIMHRREVALRGMHNLQNVLAAFAVAYAAGLPEEAMREGVQGFGGVPHRLEFVRSWKGSDWYNDSIATSPERSMAAILAFDEPVVLLAGGRDKNLPWGDFARLVNRRVHHLILFGEAAGKIRDAISSLNSTPKVDIRHSDGLKEAVWVAAEVASPGDIVLLSPGGTSFDEFRDFEDRGEAFRRWVLELP